MLYGDDGIIDIIHVLYRYQSLFDYMDMNWIDGWLNNCMMWMFALLEELVRNLRVTCHGGNYM